MICNFINLLTSIIRDIMKWISNEEVITMNENLNINWASHIYAKSSLNPYKIRKLEK